MAKTDAITQARLKEVLHYDPYTGDLTWLVNRGKAKIGSIAGRIETNGYRRIRVFGKQYGAHRLIFLYQLGWMPEQVDHDNHVRDDNRWINLNPSTSALNQRNLSKRADNTSGYCGVYQRKEDGKWYSKMGFNGKNLHLGYFDTKADAIAARAAADIKYAFHPNHGN